MVDICRLRGAERGLPLLAEVVEARTGSSEPTISGLQSVGIDSALPAEGSTCSRFS